MSKKEILKELKRIQDALDGKLDIPECVDYVMAYRVGASSAMIEGLIKTLEAE